MVCLTVFLMLMSMMMKTMKNWMVLRMVEYAGKQFVGQLVHLAFATNIFCGYCMDDIERKGFHRY